MEYCYALGYVAPVLAACGLPDWARLRRLARAFALTLTVAYATYLVYPVYFERPVLQVDTLATWLLSLEYLDKSYNHFPSLHVAITWLMYLACRDRPAGRALLVAALVVPVSTVFVKQHYVVDVAYGVALAAVAWRASRGGAVAA
jgi:membrane-associated phospholipid phosphatase